MAKRKGRIRELIDGRYIAEIDDLHPESGFRWIPIRGQGKYAHSIGTLDECMKYLSDMGFSECEIIQKTITIVKE